MIENYKILRLDIGATEEEVNKRYREFIRIFNPEEYPEEFRKITKAKNEILENLKKTQEKDTKYEEFFGEETDFEYNEDSELTGEDYYELGEEYFWCDNKNVEKSLEYYKMATENDCPKANFMLAYIHYYEQIGENYIDITRSYLYKGVLNKIDDCYGFLARLYKYDMKNNRNIENARLCYENFFNGTDFYFEFIHPSYYEDYILFCNTNSIKISQKISRVLKMNRDEFFNYFTDSTKYQYDGFYNVFKNIISIVGLPESKETIQNLKTFFRKAENYFIQNNLTDSDNYKDFKACSRLLYL